MIRDTIPQYKSDQIITNWVADHLTSLSKTINNAIKGCRAPPRTKNLEKREIQKKEKCEDKRSKGKKKLQRWSVR